MSGSGAAIGTTPAGTAAFCGADRASASRECYCCHTAMLLARPTATPTLDFAACWPERHENILMIDEPFIAHLYAHVPFCAKKCAYCAFYSETGGGATVNRYVAALIREMELVAEDLRPRTVFFGGGTPSLLNLQQWERILKA